MSVHAPTLLLAACAALAVGSVCAATIGLRQRLRRGLGWWAGASAGLAAALVCHAFSGEQPAVAAMAALLALQWPIVTLIGMRRFYARGTAGVPAWADAVALGLSSVLALCTWLAPFGWASPAQVFAAAMLAVTVHAAVAVSRLEEFPTSAVLKSLTIGLVCSAVVQAAWLGLASFPLDGVSFAAADAALAALLAPAATALLMPQLALVMNHERNVANLRASHRKLRHLVDVDTMTRLPNRRHFHELATKAIQAAPELATVLVFDIDRLKHINDVLGQSVGDDALRQVGTVLRETLRRRDVAGRVGGDEFAVVLPRTRVADTETVVARINARIDDRQVAPRIARLRLNVGAAQMIAGETLADALRRAEIALERSRDAIRLGDRAEATIPIAPPAPPAAPGVVPAFARTSGAMPLNLIPVGEIVTAQAA